MDRKTSPYFETVLIVIFTIAFLWQGLGESSEHSFEHDHPFGHIHSDAYTRSIMADWISNYGSYKYAPPYMAEGYNDTIGVYLSGTEIMTAMFSSFSGFETYDAHPLFLHLLALFSVFVLYMIIRRYNKSLALLFLPFTLLFYYSAKIDFQIFYQGNWPDFLSVMTMIFLFWSFQHHEKKGFWFLATIFMSCVIFNHASSGTLIIYFILLYIVFIRDIKLIKRLILPGILTMIVSAYFIFLVKFGIAESRFTDGSILKPLFFTFSEVSPHAVRLSDYGFFKIPIYIGIAVSLYLLWKKRFDVLVVLTLIIGAYSNNIGNARYNDLSNALPLCAAFFISLLLYLLINNFKSIRYHIVTVVFLMAIIFVPFSYGVKYDVNYLIDDYHWQSLKWIDESTEKDDTFFFFYADPYFNYYNGAYLFSKRVGNNVEINDYGQKLNSNKIYRYYNATRFSFQRQFLFPYWDGFLSIDFYGDEPKIGDRFFIADICSYDYIVFDIVPSNIEYLKPLSIYNGYIREHLLTTNFKEVFNNNVVSIIENERKNEECI